MSGIGLRRGRAETEPLLLGSLGRSLEPARGWGGARAASQTRVRVAASSTRANDVDPNPDAVAQSRTVTHRDSESPRRAP